MKVIAFLLVLCAMCGASLYAQTSSASPPEMGESGRVEVPVPTGKAMSYYRSGVVLWVVNLAWGIVIPGLFLMTGFSARIRNWAQRLGRKWFFVVGIYFLIYIAFNFLIDLPLSYYQGFLREHAYGLSNQTLQKWAGDSVKALMVSGIMGFVFLWVPFLLLRRSPKRWWFYTGLLAVPFLVFVILISPIWIDPLFNDFGPMKNKELEAQILEMAHRAGIEGSRVYEVNKSADTKTLNAYVTGFGQTKRIVLWDTILSRLDDRELLFVMGHEMGHYVLGHVWKTIAFLSILILITLYAIHRTAGWLIGRFRHRFGFEQLSDVASLPLIILLFGAYSFVVMPIVLAYSRSNEHESDRFGLEITQQNVAAARAFVKLQTDNLSNPRPHSILKLLRSSHPPLGERIDFCNEYRPWENQQPLRYGHLFK